MTKETLQPARDWRGVALTALTWLFVLLNAAPIGWMVWCSLMGNNEILQGKTAPDPAPNDVFYSDSIPGVGIVAGTVNGQLYLMDSQDPEKVLKAMDLREVATSWYRAPHASDLWVFSADGGLSRVDLVNWKVDSHQGWDELAQSFDHTDLTEFVSRPNETLPAELAQLAEALNSKSLTAGVPSPSLAAVSGVAFPASPAIVDSLNRLMSDSVRVTKVLESWKLHQGWFNPIITWLFERERTARQDRELFRWCLAERFPSSLTRFSQVRWNDIWVNRVPASGHGTSVTGCDGQRICFAMWWEDFPGIGILDPRSGGVEWITALQGLPSTSIQHLVPVGNSGLLVVSDAGLSLVDLKTRHVTANYLYGEYGLLYLDGRDVRVALYDSTHVLLAYGQEAMMFDFRNGEALPLSMPMFRNLASDITALTIEDSTAYLGSSDGIFSVSIPTWLDVSRKQGNSWLYLRYYRYSNLFETRDRREVRDAVVNVIHKQGRSLWLGGIFGHVSSVNLDNGRASWRAQVPEGRFALHWRNYQDLWRTIPFGMFLRNSFIICLSVMLISMLVASLASYALVRFEFPGKRLFGNTILATQMVPGIMYLIPIFIVFTAIQQYFSIQMVNTYHGIIIVYSAFFIPMSTWILRGFFAGIPRELEEAAFIDGCSPFWAFIRITLPAALPGIVATGIYVFLLAWDELMFAWVLCTDTSTATIPVGIRLFVGQFGNRFDLLMAAASIATLPVMLMFFLMQRHIVTGLTGGAVKG